MSRPSSTPRLASTSSILRSPPGDKELTNMAYEYPAIFSQQRSSNGGPLFACFTAPVGEIHRWTTIDRLSTAGSGHQRIKNASKVKAIVRFLELDERNTIPT